jgi:hypothetical protein
MVLGYFMFSFPFCAIWNDLFESSEKWIIEIQILHAAELLLYYKHALRGIFSGGKAVEIWH